MFPFKFIQAHKISTTILSKKRRQEHRIKVLGNICINNSRLDENTESHNSKPVFIMPSWAGTVNNVG